VNTADALTDVLKAIRLKGSTYFCGGFDAPWKMAWPENVNTGAFHVIVKGHCWLVQEGSSEAIALNQGDIIAFPTGGAHNIADKVDSPERLLERENADITLLCGTFHYDSSINHPFVKDLPCFIHVKAAQTPNLDWLRALTLVIVEESKSPTPGSEAMIDKLTEALFIQLIRLHVAEHARDVNYLSALVDPQIGDALNCIHGEQEAHWSIDKLAQHVAMSRTAFTDKFTRMVGVAPKTYLTDTRMQRAKKRLAEDKESMFTIALESGYSSEAAFSKAFKKFFNLSPGKVRNKNNTD
jgi:AraC-like DNA-binding protein